MKKAANLIEEGHRLWEEGKLEDALATIQASAELAPNLPDPWIDIAALSRELGEAEQALEADRKVVELGESEEDLIAEVAQAKARLKRAEEEQKGKADAETLQQAEKSRDEAQQRANEARAAVGGAQDKFTHFQFEWNHLVCGMAGEWGDWEAFCDPSRVGPLKKVAFKSVDWSVLDLSVIGKTKRTVIREMDELWSQLVEAAANIKNTIAQKEKADKQFMEANQYLESLKASRQ